MDFPTTFTNDHGTVEVLGPLERTFHGETPCYVAHLRSEIEAYLCGREPLHIEESPDGTLRVWYVPGDEQWPKYTQALIELNAWS